jgi:hypothetical protein
MLMTILFRIDCSLSTLTVLLQKVPHLVRPFQPQLQRTFVKAVTDTASVSIRNHAAEGLGVLMISQTRVDRTLSLFPQSFPYAIFLIPFSPFHH